jgi:excisionase family DNA binding protein
MTSGEVADLLRMPRSSVEDLARRGVIPSSKVGRHRRFLRRDIERLLSEEVAA